VPSQAIEGVASLAILAVLTVVLIAGAFARRDGSLFFTAIGLWAVARALVSTTWRDPAVTGSLNAAGLIAIAIAVTCAVALVFLAARRHRTAGRADATTAGRLEVAWPDPEPPSQS